MFEGEVLEILRRVWSRDISADEGAELIQEIIDEETGRAFRRGQWSTSFPT